MKAEIVIIEPVLTEKTNLMRDRDPKTYVFKVNKNANKYEVMQAVKEMFSVHPTSCKIMNVIGKPRSSRTKSGFRSGSTRSWKKALVTLSGGEHIEYIEGA